MGIDRSLAWSAVTLVVLAACSGGGSASPTQTNSIVSVAIRPSLTTLTAGQVQQFHAVAQDANGDSLPVSDFQWAAAPSAIASVTASGTVTVAGVGAFVLTAATNGGTARDTILAKVDSIHISPSVDTVVADSGTGQLTAQGFGITGVVVPNLAPSAFTWTSAAPATATVTTGGSVSGLQSGGPVTITASLPAALGGGQGTAHVVVRQPVVAHVAFVVIAPAVDTTTVADTFTFTATTKDSVGHPLMGRVIAWTSSDTTIAVIDAVTGQALIKATGSATITATSEGKQGTATIYGRVPWKVLSAGDLFVCGVTTGDVAYCWGHNDEGQLGIGTVSGPVQCPGSDYPPACSPTPVAVTAPTSGSSLAFKSVSGNDQAMCGITFDGQALYCWGGSLSWGSTGVSSIPTAVGPWPYPISATTTITGVAVGSSDGCAIETPNVVCFGPNTGGNIGDGQISSASQPPTVTFTEKIFQYATSINPPSGANVLATSGGPASMSCALQSGVAIVWCWGFNFYGQTGDSTSVYSDSLAYPVVFPPMSSSDLPILGRQFQR
jgi:Regulator of Chromosome Condensation (RCC1) repeat protein